MPHDGAETLFEGRHLRVKRLGDWEFVERIKTSGIVAVVAVTDEKELILVEQFRVPVGRRVIEIPAGLAGDLEGSEDEELANAAKRELLEETGYEAGSVELLTEGPPSAGLSTEVVAFFRATGLNRISRGGGDSSEKIDVHVVPLVGIDAWLETQRDRGALVDYKIYAALHLVNAST